MDVDIPRMLSLKMQKGTYDGLKELNSVLLSASTAQALFGSIDPMGKFIKIDNKLDVKVTGIYEDLPFNTQFRDLNFIAPWKLYVSSQNGCSERSTKISGATIRFSFMPKSRTMLTWTN